MNTVTAIELQNDWFRDHVFNVGTILEMKKATAAFDAEISTPIPSGHELNIAVLRLVFTLNALVVNLMNEKARLAKLDEEQ